jgi:SAM-dependent methyltransferase
MIPDQASAPEPGPAGPNNANHEHPDDPLAPSGATASARTTATYNDIAQIYYDKWLDRSTITQHLDRFVDMMRVYGLADLPLLDVGCGPGFDADFFRRAGLIAVGVDLSAQMMRAGRSQYGGDYVQADMRRLPFIKGIGGLWASASMLHVPREETAAVLRGFATLLAPGGILYLSLKAGQGAEWTAESHGLPLPRYFVYWQPDDLDAALRQAGYQIVDGWTSATNESTTWLIRFARAAIGDLDLPLTTS